MLAPGCCCCAGGQCVGCGSTPRALLRGHAFELTPFMPQPPTAGGKYVGFGSTPAPRPPSGGSGAINVDEVTQVRRWPRGGDALFGV